MGQHAKSKLNFQSRCNATELHQNLPNFKEICVSFLQKCSDDSYFFRDSGNHRVMILWFPEPWSWSCPGRPVSVRSNEYVAKTHVFVMQDRRVTTRLLTESFGVRKKSARKFLERDLQKRTICWRLCRNHNDLIDRASSWMLLHFDRVCWPISRCVVRNCTGDEVLCFQFNHEKKRKELNDLKLLVIIHGRRKSFSEFSFNSTPIRAVLAPTDVFL
jgi:hypothetical protein